MRKKVAFIIKNVKNKYSGGRIHGLNIATGLSEIGFEVDYYSNVKPIFFDELSNGNINLILNKYFIFLPKYKKYDYIFVVPHFSTVKNHFFDKLFFYKFSSSLKRINNSKLFFIDFESPNWVKEYNKILPSKFAYENSDSFIKHVDSIISSSFTGNKYSKIYYSQKKSNLEFQVLNPPINSFIADKIQEIEKQNSVIFFARFESNHKSSEILFMIIESLPFGYTLNIITNKKFLNNDTQNKIHELSIKNGIIIKILDKINDKEKFKYLAQSKLLIFASKFEGFGLPPVESQYMNTPVICSDLPVLREINKNAIFDDFNSKNILRGKIVAVINSPLKDFKASVESFAKFENFVEKLKNIL